MKHLICISFTIIFVFSLFGQDVKINRAGHIIISDKNPIPIQYSDIDGKKIITLQNMKFEGNGFYITKNGFLTIEAYEESVPVILRFYSNEGILLKDMKFNRVYGLDFSPNKEFLIFFDAKKIITLNTINFSKKEYPEASVYSIDNHGITIYYNQDNKEIVNGNLTIPFEQHPVKFLNHNNKTFVFTRYSLFEIENEQLHLVKNFEGTFFKALLHNNSLYFVIKQAKPNQFVFSLNLLDSNNLISFIDSNIFERNTRSNPHDAISSPLKYGDNHPHPIGNSYGEIQEYGGSPYLHPGVDFLGAANEEVFAVANGFVKAVLTTGGEYNWRVAIANEDTPEETYGYLYAHLVETSIPYTVGDPINSGDVIGQLIYWPWYNFTHIHFARLKSQGEVWNGAWWTVSNPLIDVIGNIDNTPPVFENAKGNQLFAFRDVNFNYLDPMQLKGDIRIIVKAHDLANSNWKIDVHELRFKISINEDDIEPVMEKISFEYDFLLDTYFSSIYENKIIETIYSRDAICYSIANYNDRKYYQVISNTSGSSNVEDGDKDILINTRDIPDGNYILSVTAKDAAMNETVANMVIGINNTTTGLYSPLDNNILFYPNPSNGNLTIENAEGFNCLIIDVTGRIVMRAENHSNITKLNITNLNKGIYTISFYKDGKKIRKRLVVN